MTRKLASIQEILEIRVIPGADAIQHYRINDWWVVDKINQYKVGDIVVYCEIDSFIKTEYAAFLSKGKEPKQYKGIRGERLRTIKLRGALSQGLILPTTIIPDRVVTVEHIGEDVTDVLGIVKWELELPAQLAGQVNGTFPSSIPKTSQERAQNLKAQIFQTEDTWTPVQNEVDENTIQRLIAAGKFRYNADNVLERFTEAQAQLSAHYEITMKMDGSSITNWFDPVKLEPCVASRNYELKVNDDNQGNAFVRMHIDSGLNQVLPIIFERTGIAYAVQGELMGAGIQGNREMLKFNQLFVFDVFNITEQRYLTPTERKTFMEMLNELPQINKDIVRHAPIMHYDVTLGELGLNDVQDLLNFSEGKSLVNPVREGVVFKRMDGKFSFKAISNTYLIQTKG